MNLQYGDKVKFPVTPQQINKVINVVPIRFDTIDESWIVCEQKNATHMLIVMEVSRYVDSSEIKYMMIEIGKCDNIYLLADAIVD